MLYEILAHTTSPRGTPTGSTPGYIGMWVSRGYVFSCFGRKLGKGFGKRTPPPVQFFRVQSLGHNHLLEDLSVVS